MDFAEPYPPIVYPDTMAGELFIEKADVGRFRLTFQQLVAQALSPTESLKVIREAASTAQRRDRGAMDLSRAKWRKSSRRSSSGNCVEIAEICPELSRDANA